MRNSVRHHLGRSILATGLFVAGLAVVPASIAMAQNANEVILLDKNATAEDMLRAMQIEPENEVVFGVARGSNPSATRGVRVDTVEDPGQRPGQVPNLQTQRPPTPQSSFSGCKAKPFDVSIEFAVNSAELKPDFVGVLREMARMMRQQEVRTCHFAVNGHTDSSGTDAHNLELSKRRAITVAEFLGDQGIPSQRLEVRGYGETELRTTNPPTDSSNRRVEIEMIATQ